MTRVGCFLAIALTTATVLTAWAQVPNLTDLLDTYHKGGYEEAVRRAAAIEDLGPLRLRFVQEVPVWIRAEPAQIEQRRAAAAAFLLELTHARLETDWGRLADLIEFTCADLRAGQPSKAFELAWHRASVALAGRARARLWLLGEYAQLPHQPPRRRPPSKKPDPNPKHLLHALERFPDDPELQLARIVAWTWGRDQEPVRNVRREWTPPDDEHRLQREAITALQPLVENSSIGGEALVRIGQMHLAMGAHLPALQAFEQAQRRETSPAVRYLALFSAGRALELLERPDDAIKQYLAALEVVADAESSAIALASLQFIRDERESAVSVLDKALVANHAARTDPGRLIGYGSFMHWPELQASMRAALVSH